MTSVFVAGPFFTYEQEKVIEKIERLLFDSGVQFYSPRLAVRLNKDSPIEEQDRAFHWDIVCLELSDWVIAVVDDWDAGTMWEIGYCHPHLAADRKKVIAYSDVSGRGLNVMLARSCYAFVNGIDELRNWLKDKVSGDWQGEVF